MAKDYQAMYTAQAALLAQQAEALGIYSNTSGKGDGREDLLRSLLAERVGSSFAVAKGEIVDSSGRSTREHDIIVYAADVFSCLNVVGDRKIIAAESVAVVVEVKSDLVKGDAADESVRVGKLAALHRRYNMAPLMRLIFVNSPANVKAEIEEFMQSGVGARLGHQDVPPVVTAYFAYRGPSDYKSLVEFGQKADADIVCVLNGGTVSRRWSTPTNNAYTLWGSNNHALGAFVEEIRKALEVFGVGRSLVTPGGMYYQSPNAKG
jgi:hypothetical protein